MSSDLETLNALQALDVRLLEKQREVDEYEETRAQKQKAIEACDAKITTLSARRKELVNERAFAERRVSDSQTQLKDRRQRVTRVRNESELRANEREISTMQGEISEHEEKLLGLMGQVEEIEAQIAQIKSDQDTLRAEEEALVSERADQIAAVTAEVAAQRAERDQVADALDDTLRKRYDLILSRRGGRAVVEVIGGSCQGCFMQVPPQTVIEVMKTRAVRPCPQCQAIIYIPDGNAG